MPELSQPLTVNPAREVFAARMNLIGNFPASAHACSGYIDTIYPLPVLEQPAETRLFANLHEAISSATGKLLHAYFEDKELQRIVPLSKDVAAWLKRLAKAPYEGDLLRPDLLFSAADGTPRLCEINCRFPLNGFLMSMHADRARRMQQGLETHSPSILPILAHVHALTRGSISILKGRERGFDVQVLRAENAKASLLPLRRVEEEMEINGGKLLLELHQDELVRVIEPVVKFILHGGKAFNDPRTIFIVHDKRFLHALSNESILQRHVPDAAHRRLLLDHVVPTFLAVSDGTAVKAARAEPSEWVAKRAISGKGDGVWIGKSCPKKVWEQVLASDDTVLQPFIPQQLALMHDPYGAKPKPNPVNVVGTILSAQGGPHHMGMYRLFENDSTRYLGFTGNKIEGNAND